MSTTNLSADLRQDEKPAAEGDVYSEPTPAGEAVEPQTQNPAEEKAQTQSHTVNPVLLGVLLGVAIPLCAAVAAVAGWQSYNAVAGYFGAWSVPAMIDGTVVAATFLRLAALAWGGWRLPGSMLLTVIALGVTVYLNTSAVPAAIGTPGHPARLAYQAGHASAPICYLALAEMLAYLLKLKLGLHAQETARLTALDFIVSPVVSPRCWLMMQRTTGLTLEEARRRVQQAIRARSQLIIICPSPLGVPLGKARRVRMAALRSIRDGLLTASDVIEILPNRRGTIKPVDLLTQINRLAVATEAQRAAEIAAKQQEQAGAEEAEDLEDVPEAEDSEADDPDAGEGPEQEEQDGDNPKPRTGTKKAVFIEELKGLIDSGDLRPLSADPKERTAAAYEIAGMDHVQLNDGAARTYALEFHRQAKAGAVPQQRMPEAGQVEAANGAGLGGDGSATN